ncbi:unnamed protein product [Adineta ricciae]|uniref:Uncharacterized protein n=1 Tax=Adineta ricciae TaxID=249248 RepID=A0A815WC20_ADIRI|nr:unnamed protein product [Adineta ricciae]CAF1540088.1 unnamed protein product [Adineta ricciae]
MLSSVVTVCIGNPYRYDKINQPLASYFYRLNSPNATFSKPVLNSLYIPLIVNLFSRSQADELLLIAFEFSDILPQFNYNRIDCSKVFTLSISPAMGNYFISDWKTSGTVSY